MFPFVFMPLESLLAVTQICAVFSLLEGKKTRLTCKSILIRDSKELCSALWQPAAVQLQQRCQYKQKQLLLNVNTL